jgi:putative oxidoreductase
MIDRWKSFAPYFLSLLRIVVGLLFVEMGAAKLFAFPGAVVPAGGPCRSLRSERGSVLEFVGGWLLLVGLFTRPVAFILSGEMAFAYFIGHAPNGFWPSSTEAAPPSTTASHSCTCRSGWRPLEPGRADEAKPCRVNGF